MTNPDRYFSIVARQKTKFAYAETLAPIFAKAAAELGAQRTETALARWLNERGVQPSAGAKRGERWHRQRLPEILLFLAEPPPLNGVEVTGDNLKWADADWDSLSKSKRERFGPRYAATVWFVRCRKHFKITGDLTREEEKLGAHLANIERVIRILQEAFPLIDRST